MKTFFALLFCIFNISSYAQDKEIIYPKAHKTDTKDTIWGTVVNDPYRSLEKDDVYRKLWLEEEEEITKAYFKSNRDKIALEDDFEALSRMSYNIPVRNGPYYIEKMLSDGVTKIFYKRKLYDERILLLDPTRIDKDLKALSSVTISHDGKYAAFSYSLHGSDWQEIGVYDINRGKLINDHIANVKFSGISWLGDGFYYSRFDSVDEPSKYLDVAQNQKVYYHKVLSASEDILAYENPDNPLALFMVQTVNDRFLIIQEGEMIRLKDIKENTDFVSLRIKSNYDFHIIGSRGDNIFATTTYPSAYNGSIVGIDSHNPSVWNIIVPNQKDFLLKQVMHGDHKFFAIYQHEFDQVIMVYSDSGDVIKRIDQPTGSSTHFVAYSPEEKSLVLSENYYFCPPIGKLLSIKDFSMSIVSKTVVNFNPFKYKWSVQNYHSADGTLIPILILYNKNYEKKGPRPTLLEFYGGFGITPQPAFDPGLILFMDNGGTFAFANVRGGENSVKDWHKMGTLLNKHNTFDDVYYAARYLVDSGYTQAGKIAITGGSNGGLVGAVVANQHPDYFKVALLEAGVYDMIRSEKFTVGAYNKSSEFGSIDDEIQFKNLLSYSPIHNIKAIRNTLRCTSAPQILMTGSLRCILINMSRPCRK